VQPEWAASRGTGCTEREAWRKLGGSRSEGRWGQRPKHLTTCARGGVLTVDRPDESVFASGLGFGQSSVDRSREGRIVQLDRDVVAVLAAGLLPSRAALDRADREAEIGGLVALLVDRTEGGALRVSVLMVPLKEPLAAWVKVPMVAMSKFLLLRATTAAASMAIGEAGMIGRAPLAAGAQRRMATRGFFVSRCKAEGGGKKPRGAIASGRSRRSRPRLDQANREAARLSPNRKFYAVAMTALSAAAFASLLARAGLLRKQSFAEMAGEQTPPTLCLHVRRDPARGWNRTSLTVRIIVAKRFRRAGPQHHWTNRAPETQRSIHRQHAAPRPRSGVPLPRESGRAPTGAAAIFRRSQE